MRTHTPSAQATVRVPLRLDGPRGARNAQPVTFGVPFPKGMVRDCEFARICAAGGEHPVELRPLSRWSDQSVQWASACFLLPPELAGAESLVLKTDGRPVGSSSRTPDEAGSTLIDTDSIRITLASETPRLQIGRSRHGMLAEGIVACTDRHGRHEARLQGPPSLERGVLSAKLRWTGIFRQASLQIAGRIQCFGGTGLVRLDVALHNPRAAKHAGGLWDLGDTGSVLFRELCLEFQLSPGAAQHISYRSERDVPLATYPTRPFELYQDSSGGDNWRSPNHVNRDGRVPCRFRGYRLQAGEQQSSGLRAEPVVALHGPTGGLCVAVPDFWQQFPKAIEIDGSILRIGLFPRMWDDLHELQGGERKTQTIWLRIGSDEESRSGDLDWVYRPAIVRPETEWVDAAGVLPPLQLSDGPVKSSFDTLLSEARDGERGILAHRERIDEYGWRNFGDLFADHEQTHYLGPQPQISHYNNQFDPLDGFLLHFLRSGDRRWLELADALARHVADIDIYHTQQDRAAYNGGLFWFTDHYLTAATATHRTYSRLNTRPGQSYGGGPSSAHLFTTGLLHHYYLTGSTDSADAVLELADCVLAKDDGRRNILGLVDDGPTGGASVTSDPMYHGPGRGAGNCVNALLDAWTLTRRRHYLDYAETLIRRVIHPADDLAERDLLNVEKHWSYTVFLASLSKYLDVKAEAEELDAMYAYGQASLLHYAAWMAAQERPYLDHREALEFPTEAWAAQEFRKANVLRRAARHADEPSRSRFLQRGQELADRAWSDLLRFDTRHCIRAVAIVMTEGLWDCRFRTGDIDLAPKPANPCSDFGAPSKFVPQRQRVLRSLKSPVGLTKAIVRALNPRRWFRVRWRLK